MFRVRATAPDSSAVRTFVRTFVPSHSHGASPLPRRRLRCAPLLILIWPLCSSILFTRLLRLPVEYALLP